MAHYDDRQYYPSSRGDRASHYSTSHHPHPMDVVPRRSDDSQDDSVPRNYPPPDYYGYGHGHPRSSRASTAQEASRRPHSMAPRGYYDDSDYSYRPRPDRRSRHYYDDRRDRHYKHSTRSTRSPSSSRSPAPRRRRKSFSDQALDAIGLGSSSSKRRGRSHGRHSRSYSSSPSRTRSKSRHRRARSEQRIAKAVQAAITAGAVEAFRSRKDPGEWTGDKGKRILTAAITAGGTDGLLGKDGDKHSKRHLIESTLAGLASSHLVNGSHSRSRSKSHGRGRSHGKMEKLAATGALAAAGKEAYKKFQSRSRSRPRGRSSSRDSSDSRGSPDRPSRRRHRSKSVSDYINRGMEALGLADKYKDDDRGDTRDRKSTHRRRHRSPSSDEDGHSYYSADRSRDQDYRRSDRRRRHRSPPSDDGDYYSADDRYGDYGSSRQRHGSSPPRRSSKRYSRDVGGPPNSALVYTPGLPRTGPRGEAQALASTTAHRDSASPHDHQDSDPGNSTDEEKHRKKLNRDTLLSAGLATIATIHAAHGLHESVQKHRERAKLVREGDMSPEEARKRRLKGNLGDAASVGLAALSIKGVYSEWEHANSKRLERSSFHQECERKRRDRSRLLHHSHSHRQRRVQSLGPPPPAHRTVYPDEIEENYQPQPHASAEYFSRPATRNVVRSPSVGY